MNPLAAAVASAAWICAQAVAWAGGQTATVTFGERVTGITRPGQPPGTVRTFPPERATNGFPTAVDALDHALDLSNPGHPSRLLVIASDGELPDPDRAAGQARLDRLTTTGCALLWLAPPGSTPLDHTTVTTLDHPDRAIDVIAAAARHALNHARH
ncbi:MAG: hypothetical protein L0Y54_00925 [Sporichthyaceae bacterium]|nr:hypothetical protein [Sporichthyaceae bacterium]